MKHAARTTLTLAPLLCLLGGCVENQVTGAAKARLDRPVARMLVLNTIDANFSSRAVQVFGTTLTDRLAKCGVTVETYRPGNLELNASAKQAAVLQRLHPDSVLAMRLSFTQLGRGGGPRRENYSFDLTSQPANAVVWTGAGILSTDGGNPFNLDERVENLAALIVAEMSKAGVVACAQTG